jgi:hypothetical protein
VSLAQALPAALVSAVVIAVALAGSWDLADSSGASPRLSLLVAAVATVVVSAVGLSQAGRRRTGGHLESDPVELGLLFGAVLGVALGAAVVVFGLR